MLLTDLAVELDRLDAVDPVRYLLTGVPQHEELEEFVSTALDGRRAMVMPADGENAQRHTWLYDSGFPVFEHIRDVCGSSGRIMRLLSIPLGSRPLGGALHLIGEDPARFGIALSEVGRIQGRLWREGAGTALAAGASRVLDRFAVDPIGEDGEGARLLMVPPYKFDPGVDEHHFTERVRSELEASGITEEVWQHLLQYMRIGIEQGYGTR